MSIDSDVMCVLSALHWMNGLQTAKVPWNIWEGAKIGTLLAYDDLSLLIEVDTVVYLICPDKINERYQMTYLCIFSYITRHFGGLLLLLLQKIWEEMSLANAHYTLRA